MNLKYNNIMANILLEVSESFKNTIVPVYVVHIIHRLTNMPTTNCDIFIFMGSYILWILRNIYDSPYMINSAFPSSLAF